MTKATHSGAKTGRPSPRRDHLVQVATGLFCKEGFHATGIDRVLAEAGVAKMTLYKHFASKDELIAACLADVHAAVEAAIEAVLADSGPGPADRALAIVLWHAEQAASRGFDGCPFHHARAEYADPDHPAHRAAGLRRRAGRAPAERWTPTPDPGRSRRAGPRRRCRGSATSTPCPMHHPDRWCMHRSGDA